MHPLVWPFVLAIASYAVAFTVFFNTVSVSHSSLFTAMTSLNAMLPYTWGLVALATVVVGLLYLVGGFTPAAKIAGFLGCLVWLFASFCWALTGGWVLVGAIGLPNLFFWAWAFYQS